MKHVKLGVKAYEAPALETLDICVEQGFAGSVIAEDWEDGNVEWFEQETVL